MGKILVLLIRNIDINKLILLNINGKYAHFAQIGHRVIPFLEQR